MVRNAPYRSPLVLRPYPLSSDKSATRHHAFAWDPLRGEELVPCISCQARASRHVSDLYWPGRFDRDTWRVVDASFWESARTPKGVEIRALGFDHLSDISDKCRTRVRGRAQ
ncbi:uncharacterized protein G2W53_035323 [Senna tora]|uniref:Uncharacterized protein n=1 Tax=Senna tora TaxID=362788 RepID=A0A834W3X9_9FABA|nr:uncharacterized protein G2W53_035323 [Senna tora]